MWSVTAGTFSGSNNTTQVTWVPPTTVANYTISLTVGDSKNTVDTSFTVSVVKAIYTLSGQVVNQSSNPVSNVYVVITDSDSNKDSVLTNTTGNYSFADKPEGAMTISYRATTEIVNGLPKIETKDTTFTFSGVNSVLNMVVREFNTIYHDDGSQAVDWTLSGGVTNDGLKYIFIDEWLVSDKITKNASNIVPADALDINFLVHGSAGPAAGDSGLVRVRIYQNNVYEGYIDKVYYTSSSYLWGSLNSITGLAGNNISLELEFFTDDNGVSYPATTVLVEDIWIYNY